MTLLVFDYRSSNPSTYKVLHSMYPVFIFWQTAQYNLLCSVLAHRVTKLLFYNPFQVPSATFYYNSGMWNNHHLQHCHGSNDVYTFSIHMLFCRPFCPHK